MSRWFHGCILRIVPALALAGCGESSLPADEAFTTESEQAYVTADSSEDEESGEDCAVAWEKELMITAHSVVKDARAQNDGPWSFGGVMRALADDNDEQEFVKRFVESWMTDQNVDGTVVKARPKIQELVLAPWKASSTAGTYDLAKAPFELLAIVYRVDLRNQGSTGTGGGEGRFIYGVRNASSRMVPFTVIVEFKLPKRGGMSTRDWANDWHALGKLELGSQKYKEKLEEITNQFASADSRAAKNLNQLRTNEIALDLGTGHVPIWELREFHIASDGYLKTVRPALTPLLNVNGTETLKSYVEKNRVKIEKGTHEVPVTFSGAPFGAGSAEAPTNVFKWNVPGVSATLQQQFSVQTCNGCHAGDTGTNFLHVGADSNGGPAKLSDFVVNTAMPLRVAELKEVLGCD